MKKFIPYKKLSKKEQRKIDNQKRNIWVVKPYSKFYKSSKKDKLEKEKFSYLEDISSYLNSK